MYPERRRALLSRFFSGLTEQTFQTELGVADPPLIDYVAELLVRFVRNDAIFRIRNLTGRRLEEIAEMLAEAQHRLGDRQREVHRHIGDFALFWTGLYPEALQQLQAADRKDWFVDYCEQGKRSYYIASTMRSDENAQQCEVLQRLSERFELCAYGLSEVRRRWQLRESEDEQTPPGLLWN